MVRKIDPISFHEYGTRAAEAVKRSAADDIFSLPLSDAIGAAIALKDDSVMQAVIAWNGFDENLDRALEIIHSAAYMQAHFHLNDLIMIERLNAAPPIPKKWLSEHIYPNTVKDLDPSPIISMVEILNESSMPSHAPTAAISAATNSII